MVNNNSHDDFVRSVRAIGESLIKNAESIVGSERYLKSISISVSIDPFDMPTSVCIDREFYPEKIIDEPASTRTVHESYPEKIVEG